MSPGAPAVLLMPPVGPAEAAPGLSALLAAEAERWAREVAGDAVDRVAGPLAAATSQALSAAPARPLLVIWPMLPRWRPDLATGALGDLAAGAALVVGPIIDGGVYLLGMTRPLAELVALPDEVWSGGDAMRSALGAATAAGLEVGLLRAERGLRTREDVEAALADPLTPRELRAILDAAD